MAAISAAIILTGGRSSRLGTHKPTVTVGDHTMLDAVLAAVVDAARVVVVGSGAGAPSGVDVVADDRPDAGPLAGIAAGLAHLESVGDRPTVALLAADLPFIDGGALELLAVRLEAADGDVALFIDGAGRRQHLAAVWSGAALHAALAVVGDPANRPVRALYRGMAVIEVPDDRDTTTDVDTPADLAAARARAAGKA